MLLEEVRGDGLAQISLRSALILVFRIPGPQISLNVLAICSDLDSAASGVEALILKPFNILSLGGSYREFSNVGFLGSFR